MQPAEPVPELAHFAGEPLHAFEALRLVFRLTDLARQHREFGGFRFDAERQLDQRKTDLSQPVHHRFDLIEADEREPGGADGERGNERECHQELAGDAPIPGAPRGGARELAGCSQIRDWRGFQHICSIRENLA